MTRVLADVGQCVDDVLRRVGPRVVLALPLGIGKPVALANEFYRRARDDRGIDLTIVTALSLLKPVARTPLEARLLDPLVARVFGGCLEPDYARAVARGTVPPNVRVLEFYLAPGALLNAPHAQRNYLSSNYTHVARDVLARGVNVIAHCVAQRLAGGRRRLSLGSNTDVTLDLLPHVAAARGTERAIMLVGVTHPQMPFMGGQAELEEAQFDYIVDDPQVADDLYGPPNPPLGTAAHALALHASALVRDGGTLQIGIGELGDALIYTLLLRHQQNAAWRGALGALRHAGGDDVADAIGGHGTFPRGLYAATEMFIAQLLELYRAGILRRRVYDCLPLERLLAAERIEERIDAGILEQLTAAGVAAQPDAAQFAELRRHGVFREDVEYAGGRMRARGGEWIDVDLADPASRARIAAGCLGHRLRGGELLHAGFFLGPRGFYAALSALPDAEREQFGMRGVGFVNQLYGADAELRVLQRRDARFINTAMMVTLLGAAVSDALEDGRVVSGVGGQYNFVAMAHALPGARSILCVRATRTHAGHTTSNILWRYGHETIPRHLRDIVVTEYGVADLRGRTDEETIAALLNVADSRFQEALLAEARAAGKIRADYRIPDAFRANLPQRLAEALRGPRALGFFSEYPFGTDLTPEEIALQRALRHLEHSTATPWRRLRALLAALGTTGAPRVRAGAASGGQAAALRRLGLEHPRGLRERLWRRLVLLGLEATAEEPPARAREATGGRADVPKDVG